MKLLAGFAIAGVLAAAVMAAVRLAPVDPAAWHRPIAEVPGEVGAVTEILVRVEKGALAFWPATTAPPEQMLADLAAFAATQPRTREIAGSVAEGRITWVQRSVFWGFPDFITAETTATGVRLWSRQRYGRRDFGVNLARLSLWLQGR